jgi:hypothetical protein
MHYRVSIGVSNLYFHIRTSTAISHRGAEVQKNLGIYFSFIQRDISKNANHASVRACITFELMNSVAEDIFNDPNSFHCLEILVLAFNRNATMKPGYSLTCSR